MTKMVRTAQGNLVDWDLIKIQAAAGNNIADKLEITTAPPDIKAQRNRRAKMEAARKMLAQAEKASEVSAPASVSEQTEDDDNGWDDGEAK